MYDSNFAAQLTQEIHWLSEPCVSRRMGVDEMHGKAGNLPCANTVHKETVLFCNYSLDISGYIVIYL